MKRLRRLPDLRAVALWALAVAVLALVFSAYLNSSFVFDLANRLLLCL